MTREEMISRLEGGEDPRVVTLEKYQQIRSRAFFDRFVEFIGSVLLSEFDPDYPCEDNCALCHTVDPDVDVCALSLEVDAETGERIPCDGVCPMWFQVRNGIALGDYEAYALACDAIINACRVDVERKAEVTS